MPRKAASRGKRKGGYGGGGMISAVNTLSGVRSRMVAERGALDAKIAAIDSALSAIGAAPRAAGRAGPGRGNRGPRAGSLSEFISKALSSAGGPMAVKDITEAVRKLGYKTRNKTLAKSVGIALTQLGGVRKIGRGLFQAT